MSPKMEITLYQVVCAKQAAAPPIQFCKDFRYPKVHYSNYSYLLK